MFQILFVVDQLLLKVTIQKSARLTTRLYLINRNVSLFDRECDRLQFGLPRSIALRGRCEYVGRQFISDVLITLMSVTLLRRARNPLGQVGD